MSRTQGPPGASVIAESHRPGQKIRIGFPYAALKGRSATETDLRVPEGSLIVSVWDDRNNKNPDPMYESSVELEDQRHDVGFVNVASVVCEDNDFRRVSTPEDERETGLITWQYTGKPEFAINFRPLAVSFERAGDDHGLLGVKSNGIVNINTSRQALETNRVSVNDYVALDCDETTVKVQEMSLGDDTVFQIALRRATHADFDEGRVVGVVRSVAPSHQQSISVQLDLAYAPMIEGNNVRNLRYAQDGSMTMSL